MTAIADLAALSVKKGFHLHLWRTIADDGQSYEVHVSAGYYKSSPKPHYARTFPASHPITDAIEQVARMAYRYFTSTEYRPPADGEGLTEDDILRQRVFGRRTPGDD